MKTPRRNRFIATTVLALVFASAPLTAQAGAPSSSEPAINAAVAAGEGGKLAAVNRYAIKSVVIIRQLLAQANFRLPAPPS